MWNMFRRTHEELSRTNNHIEGWHRKFQNICKLSPNILQVYRFNKERENLEQNGYGTS